MSRPQTTSRRNTILSQLTTEELERLKPHLHPVALDLRRILFRPDDFIRNVYFPTTSIISLLTELSDGTGMEVGLVGNEGMLGVSAVLGGSETKLATVQGEGEALQLETKVLKEEFARGRTLQLALLRYTHALMTQVSQSAVCAIRHDVERRLARWLLMYHDRLGHDEFEMTHEFMAAMLGVRRASISEVAMRLQDRNLITYERGHIRILDRPALEKFVCECYPVVKRHFDELLSSPTSR